MSWDGSLMFRALRDAHADRLVAELQARLRAALVAAGLRKSDG